MSIKHIIIIIVASAVACVAFIVVCDVVVEVRTSDRIFQSVEDIQENHIALLLGTNPRTLMGRENIYYRNRIRSAVELYNAGKVDVILVSGDHGRKDYNEVECMRDSLISKGVPENAIVLDHAGFRTLDSVIRAKEVFCVNKLTVISQQWHAERALVLCDEYGIDAVAFVASDVRWGIPKAKLYLRELLARVKMFVDIYTKKGPKYLGEQLCVE